MRFLLLLLLAGCSTLLDRANTLNENGSYEESIALYQDWLHQHPDSDDAIVGLRHAREGWLSKKLIEVRLLRLAGSLAQSQSTLALVIAREQAWQTFPTGAATFTQEEESQYAARSILESAGAALRAKHTLQSAFLLSRHENFFQESAKSYDALKKEMRAQGARDCAALTKTLRMGDYYYGLFTQKYCRYFGATEPDLRKLARLEAPHLYRDVEVDVQNPAVANALAEVIRRDLQSTPWYDRAGAGVLRVTGASTFASTHTTADRTMSHAYVVQVPYQASHVEPKAKQDSSTLSDINAALGIVTAIADIVSATAPESRHDNGDGTETVYTTEMRNQTRFVDYQAIEHTQTFRVNLSAKTSFDGEVIPLEMAEQFEHRSIENQNAMPSVGLATQAPDLIKDADWLRTQAQTVSAVLKQRANAAWDKKFCASTVDTTKLTPDLVFRCWHSGSTHLPSSYQNWFSGTFGITPQDSEQLLN